MDLAQVCLIPEPGSVPHILSNLFNFLESPSSVKTFNNFHHRNVGLRIKRDTLVKTKVPPLHTEVPCK